MASPSVNDDLVAAVGLDALDRVVQEAERPVRVLARTVDRPDDVGRGQRRAVVELHAGAQVEGEGLAVVLVV